MSRDGEEEPRRQEGVDRQYALGRIAPGYRLVRVEPSLDVDPFLDSEAAAKRLHVTVGTLRNYRGREWRAGEAFPEPDTPLPRLRWNRPGEPWRLRLLVSLAHARRAMRLRPPRVRRV